MKIWNRFFPGVLKRAGRGNHGRWRKGDFEEGSLRNATVGNLVADSGLLWLQITPRLTTLVTALQALYRPGWSRPSQAAPSPPPCFLGGGNIQGLRLYHHFRPLITKGQFTKAISLVGACQMHGPASHFPWHLCSSFPSPSQGPGPLSLVSSFGWEEEEGR